METIGGYSAHADQRWSVEFVGGIECGPGEVRLVHGEEGAKQALRKELSGSLRIENREPI